MYHFTSQALSPGLGSLSPSKERTVGAETSCLTPGLRLSRANGQSNPSVDSISIVGAGGKVFSSAVRGRKDGRQTFRQRNTIVYMTEQQVLYAHYAMLKMLFVAHSAPQWLKQVPRVQFK